MVVRWSWLGDHLALDFANTVRRRGLRYAELITGPADLTVWLDHQRGRVARPDPVDAGTVERFIAVREPALEVLRAAAAGRPLPADGVAAVNAAVLGAPPTQLLGRAAGDAVTIRIVDADPLTTLLSQTGAAVVDLLTTAAGADLALCDAPGCGQLYLRHRPNQQWCNPHCGARVRDRRHLDRRPRAGTSP